MPMAEELRVSRVSIVVEAGEVRWEKFYIRFAGDTGRIRGTREELK